MNERRGSLLTGLGVGVGLMYFLDPGRGRRRRARVRDRLTHATRLAGDAAGATGRDVAHRASGVAARVRRSFRPDVTDDRVLVERVRARIGRVVSHPGALEVQADRGVVTLTGPVLQPEVPTLLSVVERVCGVREVVNQLDVHTEPGQVPALQGGRRPPGLAPDVWQREWSPATRLFAGALGAVLTGYGAAHRGPGGAFVTTAGLGLLARAVSNLELRRLTGIGASRRAVDVRKTITIDAPLGEVFDFWCRYENFPRFMSRVLEVRPGGREGHSHWKVAGPGGMPIGFDAEVSAFEPNEVFGWRTLANASVGHAGIIRFEPAEDGGTRLDIRMSYNPPGGWIGHGVATAFGVDPKLSLDEDLARLKTLLETGRPARDAAQSPRV